MAQFLSVAMAIAMATTALAALGAEIASMLVVDTKGTVALVLVVDNSVAAMALLKVCRTRRGSR